MCSLSNLHEMEKHFIVILWDGVREAECGYHFRTALAIDHHWLHAARKGRREKERRERERREKMRKKLIMIMIKKKCKHKNPNQNPMSTRPPSKNKSKQRRNKSKKKEVASSKDQLFHSLTCDFRTNGTMPTTPDIVEDFRFSDEE